MLPTAIRLNLLPLPRSISPRRGLLLISLPVAPRFWPSHLDLASPLISATSKALKQDELAINAIYDGTGTETTFRDTGEGYIARLHKADGSSYSYPAFGLPDSGSSTAGATTDGSPSVNGEITGIEQVRRDLDRMENRRLARAVEGTSRDGKYTIFVCTHGSRDCRCSDQGVPLVAALRREVMERGLEERIQVGEIAHVGGHKYAANALLLPSLDLLGNLRTSHAPRLISFLLSGRKAKDPMWTHWRGRYGLSEKEQEGVWNMTNAAHAEERDAETLHGIDGKSVAGAREAKRAVLGREVGLRFKTFEGEVKEVVGRMGENLLEVGKRAGLSALEGVCGGNLECATCHLYLPPSAPAPAPSEEELDMLGYAISYRDGESRLGCQIKVTDEMEKWTADGGVISLPRY